MESKYGIQIAIFEKSVHNIGVERGTCNYMKSKVNNVIKGKCIQLLLLLILNYRFKLIIKTYKKYRV